MITSGRIVDIANAQHPDLFVLLGDYVTAQFPRSRQHCAGFAWPCAQILRGLRAPFGSVAILGNHDFNTDSTIVSEALSAHGHLVLRNRSVPLEPGGRGRLWLAGFEDLLKNPADPAAVLQPIPEGECVLALVHEPDYADQLCRYPIDFQISGHSHGGQIRCPGVGALWLPEGAWKYPMGFYRLGPLQLYSNRGVGVTRLPLRLLCPPEITVFTLRRSG